MKILLFFFLASFTIFADLYFINPMLTFGNLSLILIIYLTLIHNKVLKNQWYLLSNQDQTLQSGIIKSYLIFILYIFIVHIFRGEVLFAFKNIILQLGIICSLLLFNYFYYEKKYDFLKYLYFFLLAHFIFVILQINNVSIVLSDLIPSNFLISSNINIDNFSNYKRVSGTIFSEIILAKQCIFFLVVFIAYSLKDPNLSFNIKNLFFIMITIFILFATQVRSAIFSFIPIISMCYLYYGDHKINGKFTFLIIFFSLVIFLFSFFIDFFVQNFPYVFKTINLSDTHRFYTSWSVAKGTLLESPLFGISQELGWDIFDQYRDINYNPYVYINPSEMDNSPTNHNQLLYYIRNYGLIGLALWINLYFRIFKAIKLTKVNYIRFIVGSIFVLDLFFSMAHNNKIFTPLLWIILSLNFAPSRKE